MRRWNGWGDSNCDYPLSAAMVDFLRRRLGTAAPPLDATRDEALAKVPPSRLSPHPQIDVSAQARLLHAHGQSLPDWVALRSGAIGPVPDGVAWPQNRQQVRQLLSYAATQQIRVIPYGGGTSVVGHLTPEESGSPSLTVDMRRMNRLLHLDSESQLACFEAGVTGPDLEAALRAHNLTLGHYPQSFEHSTLGGWVCARSSGQQSLGYGRIEQLFAGGQLETIGGELSLPPLPASAAGPDLKELLLGSEGRYGILTEATLRVRALPARETFRAVFFPNFDSGIGAVKELARQRLPLTMLRLSNPRETATTLVMAGHERLLDALQAYLRLRGAGAGKCLLLYGAAGSRREVAFAVGRVRRTARNWGGVAAGATFGRQWQKSRFKAPYLRNALWDAGYAIDTFETALPWQGVKGYVSAVEERLSNGLCACGEAVHIHTHLSHVYPDGCSAYSTYLFRLAAEPEQTLDRWQRLKQLASETIVAHGGTISHQHGVGTDHRAFLAAEKGETGMQLLTAVGQALDPTGIMNPGKLF